MSAVEMSSLRKICGVSLDDRTRNEKIHTMAGPLEYVTVEWRRTSHLTWFGYFERMNDERMAKNIYEGKVSGKRGGVLFLTFNILIKSENYYRFLLYKFNVSL